jgi:F420H(2)-dependent quinone reductase
MSNLSVFEQWVGVPMLRLHDAIYQRTHGWIGHRIPGAPPCLLLHTVGAKTGQPRTTSLMYARDGGPPPRLVS